MQVRLKDVARASGVSVGTASRILNDADYRIAPDTRDRVRQAAEELGYVTNAAARSLRTNRTRLIAAVTDSIVTTSYAHQIIHGIQSVTAHSGYLPVILSTGDDPKERSRAIDMIRGHQVEGVLLAAMYHRPLAASDLPPHLPVIGLNGVLDSDNAMSFVPDDHGGAYAATRLLLDAGHQRIMHLSEEPTDGLARGLRIAGFQQAMTEAGLSGTIVQTPHHPDQTRSGSVEAHALSFLTSPERPTAIFAFNDLMALGIFRAAHHLGLRIPEDLSVVGFDNLEFVAQEVAPGLTTVQLPHEELGRRAAHALLGRLGDNDDWSENPGVYRVDCPLVIRDSVAPPPS